MKTDSVEREADGIIATFDAKIFDNPANRYCVVRMKTDDTSIPEGARSSRRYPDHLIRFTAVGYDLPLTNAVRLKLDGEWIKSKYGLQLQVESCQEIVTKTEDGVRAYLGSGLIKGIGQKTAAQIVARFGTDALDILEHTPERLLEISGITEKKLEDIKASYTESRALRDIIALLAPFQLTPKMAAKIYQELGPASVDILRNSPFELCRVSGIGFKRVDAIIQKTDPRPHDPMRIRGAVRYALDEARSKNGHLFLSREDALNEALKLLNEKLPVETRLHRVEVEAAVTDMALEGQIVLTHDAVYLAAQFSLEDETAHSIAKLLSQQMPAEDITSCLANAKEAAGLVLSEKQEIAVQTAFANPISIITGSPGTGKTTVLKMILEVYRALHPGEEYMMMAPTGRASRRMAESTGCTDARTMHSSLGLISEEDEDNRTDRGQPLHAGLIIVDETSMVDMWLAKQFFTRIRPGTRLVLVGDADQLPSVGAGNVFRELMTCGLVPVTVLDRLFRQAGDSLIAHNAKFINEGNTRLYYGNDFVFVDAENQEAAARILQEQYCKEIAEHGVAQVQILSPFRTEGAAGANLLNTAIQETVNPFSSEEDEIHFGKKIFRVGDRIMQTRNTKRASNGDLGFIRAIQETPDGKLIQVDFGEGRNEKYSMEDLADLDLAYATTVHKAMGSECLVILMPLIRAHTIMLYRNLLYTGITRAKQKVVLVGQKSVLFMAISRSNISKRNTQLGERIKNYCRAFTPRKRPRAIDLVPDEWKAVG